MRTTTTVVVGNGVRIRLDSVAARLFAVACSEDSHGFGVLSFQRHPKCHCPIPCQARFRCEGKGHKGPRATPWCNGASEDGVTTDGADLDDVCDDCANASHDARSRVAARSR